MIDAVGNEIVVALDGEVDVERCQEVREQLHGLVDEGARHVVLDLTHLHFLDSTALGMLVGLHRRLTDEDGLLELRSPTAPIRRALAVSGLDKVLTIVE